MCLYFQMQYKAKKPQRQLNIKVEETKPALYNKDNIDDLYLLICHNIVIIIEIAFITTL